MTINGNAVSRVAAAAGVDRISTQDENTQEASQGSSASSVEVSDRGRQLAELSELVRGSDDVRSDLVNDFKTKIVSGDYKVDFDQLASNLAQGL